MIFDRLFSPASQAAATPAPHDDFWYSPVGMATHSGITLSPEAAMRCTPVNAAVKLLSETIASLPLFVFRRLPKGKQKASNHPLYDVLHREPNSWQSSFEFRETMQRNCLLHGNAYARIVAGRRGPVEELIPLPPKRVEVKLLDNGRLQYIYTDEQGKREIFSQDEVFHLRMVSQDGYVGTSPIDEMSEAVAMSIAAEAYGARFFSNDAKPPMWIEHPSVFKDDAARQRFRAAWQAAQTGTNAHKTAVLEDGMKLHELAGSNKDSQFLETRKFQVEEVARIYNIPLPYLKDDARATFANSEQKALDFQVITIRPWLVRWEQAMSRALFLRPDLYFAEFEMAGIVRGDIKSRYEAYGHAVTTGWMTRNEVRDLENMNPIEGLDEPLHQAALVPEQEGVDEDAVADALRSSVDREMGALRHVAKGFIEVNADQLTIDERLTRLTREAAQRIATREIRAARKALQASGTDGMRSWAGPWYEKHQAFIVQAACTDTDRAETYVQDAKTTLLAAIEAESPGLLDQWEKDRLQAILAAIEQPAIHIRNEIPVQDAPRVEVQNTIENQIPEQGAPEVSVNVEAPEVSVDVPEQAPPVVTVENKIETPEPSVQTDVHVPERKRAKLRVIRNDAGSITGVEEE